MKISSFIATGMLIAMSIGVYAQKAELKTAKSSYEKYSSLKGLQGGALAQSSLKEARVAIDKATEHEKTKGDPETWTYRALIYADLAVQDTTFKKSQGQLTKATEAIAKATELDKEGKNKANIENAKKILAQYSMNKGVKEFQNKNYSGAYRSFEDVLKTLPGDTTVTYYAGLSAMMAKDYPAAIKKYTELLKTDFSNLEDVYTNLSISYTAAQDTASAIRIAGEAAEKFPKNPDFATREIELSLMSGKEKEVISKIEAQAQKEPQNKLYPYYLGIAYNSVKDYDKAEEAYKRALAIDPNYPEANINMGGLIMNQGIDTYNKANALPTSKQKEYDAMMKQAQAKFDKAFPFLQKAAELNPKSRLALENLKTYYIVKKNDAKVNELKTQIEALPQ